MEQRTLSKLEELLRLLAAAASAARLYPPSSELPKQAVDRFTEAAWAITAAGPVRFLVDPAVFRFGEEDVASGNPQVTGLAETLHALQVGQLVIAPGLTTREVDAFIQVTGTDPKEITTRGGVRACLVAAGVGHIAVIEVSLRPSTEQGILGLDLTLAPFEEIGAATIDVAAAWRSSALQGEGIDDMATAIERLEPATRELASRRVAQALLRLPEATRREVLASALRPDRTGRRMDGMLAVVAQMKPSALARLLTLVGKDMGLRGLDLARSLDLPPEVMREILLLLSPSPQSEEERGVPADPDVESTADEMAGFEEDEEPSILSALAAATPTAAASKALGTTLAILATAPSSEAVAAVGDALPRALRTGAIEAAAMALEELEPLGSDPELGEAVSAARHSLSDSAVVAEACARVRPDTDPARLAVVINAGGAGAADALIGSYMQVPEPQRGVLLRAAGLAAESVIPAAGRELRTGETIRAISAVRLLASLRDKRAVPVLAQALDHVDITVRRAAVTALADFGGPEAATVLGRALQQGDLETRRFVAHEIGRARVGEALPALTRVMDDMYVFDRNHELKKEVLKSLESFDPPTVMPVLEKVASRRFVAGRKNRELQYLARRALERLKKAGTVQREDMK